MTNFYQVMFVAATCRRAQWLGLFAVSAGCSAEARVPRIIISQTGVEVPGVPNPNGVITTTTTRFDHPVGFEVPKVLDASLYPTIATVTTPDSYTDLRFVQELTLVLASRSDEELPAREVANFVREPNDASEQPFLNIPTSSDFNVVQYWAAGDAYYELIVRGTLPEDDWTLDIIAEFEGTLSL